MTFELLSAFLIYAFVSAITPGPNNMMLMASGLNFGVARTLPHALGVALGFGFMVFLAGMGLFSVLEVMPLLYHILQGLSVAYLLYLAWKIANAAPLSTENSQQKKPISFLAAAAFQWVNPKAIVMAIVAITTYIPVGPEHTDFFINVIWIALIYTAISLPCSLIWALFGRAFRAFLKSPVHYRVFNITMAVLLILSLYPLLKSMPF